jgi:hypothetical protein
MANNSLSILDNAKFQVPTHLKKFMEENANIEERSMTPALTYEGKTWQINKDGEKTKIVGKDSNGDETPIATMRVVILGYAKKRGRAYYEGAYDPKKPGTPLCWSDNGDTPEENVPKKQADVCASCPKSVKGSKVNDNGVATTACAQHRMVAVVPANNMAFQPLRLKLAITSDFDGRNPENEANGWFGFSNYTRILSDKGVAHTAALVTKMKFDVAVAWPKVIFSPDRWLTEEELEKVIPVTKSPEVASLLDGTWTPDGQPKKVFKAGPKEPTPEGAATVTEDDEDPVPNAAAMAAAKAKADTESAKITAAYEKEQAKAKTEAKAKADAKAARIAAAQAALAAAAADDEDEEEPIDGEIIPPAKTEKVKAPAATKPKAAAATKPAEVSTAKSGGALPSNVQSLLADWTADD